MKAVVVSNFGGPSVLEVKEVPEPKPGPYDVQVAIKAASVNHLDLDIRAGKSRLPVILPCILGREGAGVVEQVGSQVVNIKQGDRVIVGSYFFCGECEFCSKGLIQLCQNMKRPGINTQGTYAEKIIAPAKAVYKIPENLDLYQACTLQLSFGTAWHALFQRANIKPGQVVLISGAAGGVGSAAIQLAKLASTIVIAVVGSDEKDTFVKSLGADYCINYTKSDILQDIMHITNGQGVDIVLDGVGGSLLATLMQCLVTSGTYITFGAHGGEYASLDIIEFFRGYKSFIASTGWTKIDIEQIVRLASSGKIKIPIHQVLPLDKALSAHELLEKRQITGKVILSTTQA